MNYFSFSNRQLHCFKAHDHPIKCLAIDPNEEFFVTGSVDGDIKVKLSRFFREIEILTLKNYDFFSRFGL